MFTDELVGLDMAHKREMNRSSRNSQAIINDMDADIKRLQKKLAEAYNTLAIEQAHAAGLNAEIDILKTQIAANSEIMQPTGRKFDNGKVEIKLHLFYNKAFDEVVKRLKIAGSNLRAQAK